MTGYGQQLLLDNSLWMRVVDGRLTGTPRRRFERAVAASELWTCPPTLLEMRYGAREGRQFTMIAQELDALPHAPMDSEATTTALTAQAELAAAPGVSHRVKPIDLLIAATATTLGLGILHYDHDFDTISEHTSLRFASVWGAPRGSID